jgi:hypothetical protein
MTDHTIPPRELVEQWASEKCYDERDWLYELHIANRAARWGADQELEACCHYFARDLRESLALELRAVRRPKPPSLKEQALAVIENSEICDHLSPEHAAILRRALEQLDD